MAPEGSTTQIPASGLGGQKQELIVVPVDAQGRQPGGTTDGPKGGNGKYSVTLLLQKPGHTLLREREFRFGTNTGDSHVMVGQKTTLQIDVNYSGGTAQFIGVPNQRGALGALRMTVIADSFKIAKEHAYRLVAPSLSMWSTVLDLPLDLARIELVEETTGARQMSVVNPFIDTPLLPATERIASTASQDLRVFLSYYREALNSNSDAYQLLCLFKVVEGIRARRVRAARAARRGGSAVAPVRHVEAIPAVTDEFAPWLEIIFPFHNQWDEMAIDSIFISDARGKTIDDLVKPGDRATQAAPGPLCALRNEIAHTIGPAGAASTLLADESLHTARVTNWLPIAKCIVRLMLLNEFPDELWNRGPHTPVTFVDQAGNVSSNRP